MRFGNGQGRFLWTDATMYGHRMHDASIALRDGPLARHVLAQTRGGASMAVGEDWTGRAR